MPGRIRHAALMTAEAAWPVQVRLRLPGTAGCRICRRALLPMSTRAHRGGTTHPCSAASHVELQDCAEPEVPAAVESDLEGWARPRVATARLTAGGSPWSRPRHCWRSRCRSSASVVIELVACFGHRFKRSPRLGLTHAAGDGELVSLAPQRDSHVASSGRAVPQQLSMCPCSGPVLREYEGLLGCLSNNDVVAGQPWSRQQARTKLATVEANSPRAVA